MLCPEVWNFIAPKVMQFTRDKQDLDSVKSIVNRNSFYKSLVVTCPDELQPPNLIQELIVEDTDYYELSDCSLTEFVEPLFIESFIKNGKVHCLSANNNCITQNCVAITEDGVLILHVLEHIFQTLGFEGTKRPHNYYEVKIDLKAIKNYGKVKSGLSKLELFNLCIVWEPDNDKICPSSLAKYFNDRDINVSVRSLKVNNVLPDITEVPSMNGVDVEDMSEWIGMLAHNADLNPTETYISSYEQPQSKNTLETTRISILIVKGFIPPTLVCNLCEKLNEYVLSRDAEDYWASISLQSNESSLWQWNPSSPKMFQAHDSSCNVFFTQDNNIVHSIGQLKFS